MYFTGIRDMVNLLMTVMYFTGIRDMVNLLMTLSCILQVLETWLTTYSVMYFTGIRDMDL